VRVGPFWGWGLASKPDEQEQKRAYFGCSEGTMVLCERVDGRCVYVPSYMRQVRYMRSALRSYHSHTTTAGTHTATHPTLRLSHIVPRSRARGPRVQHVAEYTHEQAVVPNGQLAADLPHTHAF
jgi:hypothetical protein